MVWQASHRLALCDRAEQARHGKSSVSKAGRGLAYSARYAQQGSEPQAVPGGAGTGPDGMARIGKAGKARPCATGLGGAGRDTAGIAWNGQLG